MQAADPAGEWSLMRAIVPRAYVCHRAAKRIPIDGAIDEALWRDAPWTEDFVDIEGARRLAPRFRTRARMLWDDEFFYVAAELAEPHVCATLTEKNSIIFHDNDFEIFIDPDGDNHNYYEFEINALATIWELTVPRPYKDGGKPRHGTNLDGLLSGVQVRGTLNDPRDQDQGWTVAVALPWKQLAAYNPDRATPPKDGDFWRVNFSRVQWEYDIVNGNYLKQNPGKQREANWVWSPQGIIDMHRPERWGFVRFTSKPAGTLAAEVDPTLPARDSLMEVYHRQRAFRARNGRWAGSLEELGITATCITLAGTESGFVATTSTGGSTLSITEDSRLVMRR